MYLDWKKGGLTLAAVFFLAVALVKPIGVSTQFVIVDGILADTINPDLVVADETTKSGYSSSNEYLNKSGGKYAKSIAEPLNYGLIFVLSMVLGGFIGSKVSHKGKKQAPLPEFHTNRFGDTPTKRYLLAFAGGFISLWGARLAGGCTSGHMMSGMMQTSVSGYLFAMAAFAAAVPVSIWLYRK